MLRCHERPRASLEGERPCPKIREGVRLDTPEMKPWPAAPKRKKLSMMSSGNPNAVCGDHSRKSPAHSFLLDKPIPLNY